MGTQRKGQLVFCFLPFDFSKEIRENLQSEEEGWGRLKATAKIGITEWKTAIWYDTKLKTYLLPIKRHKKNRTIKHRINTHN